MQSGYTLTVEGKEWTQKTTGSFDLKFLQKVVGGSIQITYTRDKKTMVVNESGMIDGLPVNEKATELLHSDFKRGFGFPVSIHGDVFIFTKGRLH